MKRLIIIIAACLSVHAMASKCTVESDGTSVSARYTDIVNGCEYSMRVFKDNSKLKVNGTCHDGISSVYTVEKVSGMYYESLLAWDKYGVLITEQYSTPKKRPGDVWHERMTEFCNN